MNITGAMEIFGQTQISSWEIGQMDESPSSRFGSNAFSMETSSKLYLQPFSPFSPENIGVVPVIRDNAFQHIDPVVESLKRKKNVFNPFKVKNLEDNMEELQIDEISPQPDEWNHDDDQHHDLDEDIMDQFSENVNVPNIVDEKPVDILMLESSPKFQIHTKLFFFHHPSQFLHPLQEEVQPR
jgi:hypothetical protein